jgi:hypothetical protein
MTSTLIYMANVWKSSLKVRTGMLQRFFTANRYLLSGHAT